MLLSAYRHALKNRGESLQDSNLSPYEGCCLVFACVILATSGKESCRQNTPKRPATMLWRISSIVLSFLMYAQKFRTLNYKDTSFPFSDANTVPRITVLASTLSTILFTSSKKDYTMSKKHVFSFLLLLLLCIPPLISKASSVYAASTPNQNCSLLVPANPLTATGLATPYQLVATDLAAGPCNETNTAQSAFVQAAIIDPTGAVSIYTPLVIDAKTQPAIAPILPTIPANSIVALWFGFNGNKLTLSDTTNCVNGIKNSVFGQFAYCNAPAFFAAAQKAIIVGSLVVPPLGIASDGLPCPTVRDFSVVDQDQSDNVQSQYLVINGSLAQKNDANSAANPTATTLSNPSDNALLSRFIDPTLGCTAMTAPALDNAGMPTNALALDELQAWSEQQFPYALVPVNDPMVQISDKDGDKAITSIKKDNAYRAGVGQHAIASGETATQYCKDIIATGIPRIILDKSVTSLAPSPVPAQGNTLYTFLASRMQFTLSNNGLNCVTLLHMKNPVTLTLDNNGVTIAATLKS
jgi:hypothetical protein